MTLARVCAIWIAGCLAMAGGCAPRAEGPGYPLYPNPQNALSRDQVAQLVGVCSGMECTPPIGSVDGQDVSTLGGTFDLLPGCHVVQLQERVIEANPMVMWSGSGPRVLFAMKMRAAHRYVIKRDIIMDMGSRGRMVMSAKEEAPDGNSSELLPARSSDEIRECQEWRP